ncbi:MAG TPA: C39 family peptidase [Candidatus Binatia bacterium]|nr:C39 family peptidase [Candidatus Binatia bacterium]
MTMLRLAAAGAIVASAALHGIPASAASPAAPTALAATQPAPGAEAAPVVRLLDVPYVPQSERLCGGAALAMVLRYWGDPRARAEDFASLVLPGENGIRGDSLVAAARARGCPVFPMQATAADLRDHLARGRPVIALLDTGTPVRHYVVLLAATPTGVILHDPAVGPFQTRSAQDFDKAWNAAGRWALLVLPPQGREGLADPSRVALEQSRTGTPAPPPPDTTAFDTPVIPEVATSGPTISGCDGMVSEGVQKARTGADAEAAGLLNAAATICPTSAAPVRELAGLRFREKRYADAGSLARRAIELEPNDAYTWRLLAGSRYMDGDVQEALEAWNHVSEPRSDLIKVEGLRRTRYEAVSDQVDLPPGYLITWDEYRRAQRRLDEVPAASRARMEVRPSADGAAQVRIAVSERPLLFDGPLDLGIAAGRAVASNEVALRLSSPLRLGELWTARYRFQQNRPRGMLTMDAPALGGRPGLFRLEGMGERQTYALQPSVEGVRVREDRRRVVVSYGDWISPDWRMEFGGGLERFVVVEAGGHNWATVQGALEAHSVGDHFAFTLSGAGWATGGERAFRAGDLLARYGSDDFNHGDWLMRAGFSAASSRAPLALWPGASNGSGRDPLLRAHPLLEEGIVNGLIFGRRLAYGNFERRVFPWEVKTVRIGLAAFLDTGKAWEPLVPRDIPWQFDVGGGLRLASLGGRGELRIDFGYGLRDQETAISAGLSAR